MQVSQKPSRQTEIVAQILMVLVTCVISLFAAEIVLRLKNSTMDNYDIEMWRYSSELKQVSPDPVLGHIHKPSREAVLQNVNIRIDENGLRGASAADASDFTRRIVVLGSSITLGWGVEEGDTMTSQLESRLRDAGEDVRVLNAGIGNYNSPRYVKRFMDRLTQLDPTDIVVHYFLRDAETLEPGGGNFLLRNSQLAVTVWIAVNRVFGSSGHGSLVEHYRSVYAPDAIGRQAMEAALKQLAEYGRENNIRLYLAMVPDVHNLEDYQFGFIHEELQNLSEELGYRYVDLKPAFGNLSPEDVWAMPGDPHPNALGHKLMADAIFPFLLLN